MNKSRAKISLALIVVMIIVLFVPADSIVRRALPAPAELVIQERGSNDALAAFPKQLQYVGCEAFAGTAFETAVFDHALIYIGSNAFSDADLLSDVYIPERTEHIGEHAFLKTAVIHGVEGTYAHKWSEQNGNRFRADDIWTCKSAVKTPSIEPLLILLFFVCPAHVDRKAVKKACIYFRSMRPQDRPELYEINYRFP